MEGAGVPTSVTELNATVASADGSAYLRLTTPWGAGVGGRRVQLECNGVRFSSCTIRMPGHEEVHGLSISAAVLERTGLQVGDEATIRVPNAIGAEPHIPADVASALSRAGLTTSVLSDSERRLALALVREAGSPGARSERVAALLQACMSRG